MTIALEAVGLALLLLLVLLIVALLLRWRFQYSLRSLLLLAVAVAVPFIWLTTEVRQARTEQEIVEMVQRAGGWVAYDYGPGSFACQVPPYPEWFRKVVGDCLFGDVVSVCVNHSDSRISDAELAQFQKLSKLQTLRLERTDITDAGLKHLAALSQLEELNLTATRVSDAGLASLETLTRLSLLALRRTKVTDAGMAHLEPLTRLVSLDLSHTEVGNAGLRHLRGLAQLTTLDLSDTKVTDAGLIRLGGLRGLKLLELAHTGVTDDGATRLKRALPSCTITFADFDEAIEPSYKAVCSYEGRAVERIRRGDYAGGIADLETAMRLNPKDQAAKFEAWPKAPLSVNALRHGQKQLAKMLRDRKTMGQYGKLADPLYQWAVRKFAGEYLGEGVFWDDAAPVGGFDACHGIPMKETPAWILVREERREGGRTIGRSPAWIRVREERREGGRTIGRSFEDMWSDAVFELYNVTNAKEFLELHYQTLAGGVSKEQYVTKMAEIESHAAEKTRSFYIHVFLPWAKLHHVATNPSLWYLAARSDPSEKLVLSRVDRNGEYWLYWSNAYDDLTAWVKTCAFISQLQRPFPERFDLQAGQTSQIVEFSEAVTQKTSNLECCIWNLHSLDHESDRANGDVLEEAAPADQRTPTSAGDYSSSPKAGSPENSDLAATRQRIEPLDVLTVSVRGALWDEPIRKRVLVEPSGRISLGASYGRVKVARLTPQEAEAAIKKHLSQKSPLARRERDDSLQPLGVLPQDPLTATLTAYDVKVLAAGHASKWRGEVPRFPYRIRRNDLLRIDVGGSTFVGRPIAGEYLVDGRGNVQFGGDYGNVLVKGLTLEEAEEVIGRQLGGIEGIGANPPVSVTLAGWKR